MIKREKKSTTLLKFVAYLLILSIVIIATIKIAHILGNKVIALIKKLGI